MERLRSTGKHTAAGGRRTQRVTGRRRRATARCDSIAPGRRRPAGLAAALAIGLAGLIVAGAAVAAGCGASPQQISLTSKDNLATIKAAKGDTIVLKLDENPSTGYHWIMQFSAGLKLTSSTYEQRSGTQNLVGAGGTHTWTIDATETGTQAIIGTYQPPRPAPILPNFKVVIQVN
jgi:predicted secreted protein